MKVKVSRGSTRHHNRKEKTLSNQPRAMLQRLGIRPRKRLGQNFLVDESVLDSILAAADLTSDDIVLEIGPGLGVLTMELARKAGRVVAIELDDKLAAMLKKRMASFDNTVIVNTDILDTDPVTLLQEQREDLPPRYKAVANLPYYITAPVLRHFLEASAKPELMVVMVQKEVAETIVAEAGHLSILGISIQFYGRPRIVRYVPARCFYPVPKVDSAILRIDLYPRPLMPVSDEAGFFSLVRAGFSTARKQLVNSLSQGLNLPKADTLSLLEKAGIKSQRRAETLTLEEWATLYRVFSGEER